MGLQDRIYGVIFCRVGSQASPRHRQVLSSTLVALELLPRQDEHPPLTRNMFSLTAADYRTPGLYKELVVHFGLTLKDIESTWDVWLDKLESFLERLEWREARLHLELEREERRYEYCWSVPAEATPAVRSSWKLAGGPRELGGEAGRTRDAVSETTAALQRSPDDPDLLYQLILGLGRLRRYDEALEHFVQLEAIDPEMARSVPPECLQSWADRCLLS